MYPLQFMISVKLYIDFSVLRTRSFPCWLNSNYSLHSYIDFNRLLDNFVPGRFQITLNEFVMTIDIKASILQQLEKERNCFSSLLHRPNLLSACTVLTRSSQLALGCTSWHLWEEKAEKNGWFCLSEPNDEYIYTKLWWDSLYKLVFLNKYSVTFHIFHQSQENLFAICKIRVIHIKDR